MTKSPWWPAADHSVRARSRGVAGGVFCAEAPPTVSTAAAAHSAPHTDRETLTRIVLGAATRPRSRPKLLRLSAIRLRPSASRFHRGGRRLSRSHRRRWRRRWRLELRGVRYRVRLRPFPLLREVGDLVFSLHIGLRSGRSLCAIRRNSNATDCSTGTRVCFQLSWKLPPKVSKRIQSHQEHHIPGGIAIV